MNIVFFGSSEFAVAPLKAMLASGYKVSLVVTQPDRKQGRGLSYGSTAVKITALENQLKVYQPGSINQSEAISVLKELKPDLFVVIAYGQILSQQVLDIPKIFALNMHASLLPKYRGAAPINWAIINGEEKTGVSSMKMTKLMDAGPIIAQSATPIKADDNAAILEQRLSCLAAELLLDTLKDVGNNTYKLIPQDNAKVSLAPKLKKEDGLIDWEKPAEKIFDLIRGCFYWPGAYTYYQGKLLKIFKASIGSGVLQFSQPKAGEILGVAKEGIIVACREGYLVIEELQIENKRRMSALEFISGHKIKQRERLGKK